MVEMPRRRSWAPPPGAPELACRLAPASLAVIAASRVCADTRFRSLPSITEPPPVMFAFVIDGARPSMMICSPADRLSETVRLSLPGGTSSSWLPCSGALTSIATAAAGTFSNTNEPSASVNSTAFGMPTTWTWAAASGWPELSSTTLPLIVRVAGGGGVAGAGAPTVTTTAALSAGTATLTPGWPEASTSRVTSPTATPGSVKLPSAPVTAWIWVPLTRTVAPAIGAWALSLTTPPTMRVSTGAGATGAGFAITSWSDRAEFAPSTGIWRAVKPSAVTSIVRLVIATPVSLKDPSAPVVAEGPPPLTATVAFATGLVSTSTTVPEISRVLPRWANAVDEIRSSASKHTTDPNGWTNRFVSIEGPLR